MRSQRDDTYLASAASDELIGNERTKPLEFKLIVTLAPTRQGGETIVFPVGRPLGSKVG
jgi:hypothetical protein